MATVSLTPENPFFYDLHGENDTVTGSDTANLVVSGNGDDTVDAKGGNDIIDTGDGHDIIDGGSGDDTIYAGNGDDRIEAGEGHDIIDAGDGDDWVEAGNGDDTIDAGNGDDYINPGLGADLVDGGAGLDHVVIVNKGGQPLSSEEIESLTETASAGIVVDGGFSGNVTAFGAENHLMLENVEVIEAANTGSYLGLETSTFLVAEGMSIQAAIDKASDGDIILLDDGVYFEQISLDGFDNLTIMGGSNTVIAMPDQPETSIEALDGRDRTAVITVENSENITLQNLTIDGRGLGDNIETGIQADFEGVLMVNSSGHLEALEVTGIRQALTETGNLQGNQRGQAIVAYNTDAVARDIQITQSYIYDFQKNGIYVNGEGLSALIAENMIEGHGLLTEAGSIAQNGVVAANGAAAIVDGNSFSEIGFVDTSYTTTNVLLQQAADGSVISNNIFEAATDNTGQSQPTTHFGVSVIGETDNITVNDNSFNNMTFGMYFANNIDSPEISGNEFNNMFPSITIGENTYQGYDTFFDGRQNDEGVSLNLNGDGDHYIVGTDFSDNIMGGDSHNYIIGGSGDDYISLSDGDNTIVDDIGNSDIQFGHGNNSVFVGLGNAHIAGGSGDNEIRVDFNILNDTAEYANDNSIILLHGNNDIMAGDGSNNIVLGHGNNTVVAGIGSNTIEAGDGNNTIQVGIVDYNVASDFSSVLSNNTITTGDGDNSIITGYNNDHITLGGGDDYVNSSTGIDFINTGAGLDHVVIGDKQNMQLSEGEIASLMQSLAEGSVVDGGFNGTFYNFYGDGFMTVHNVEIMEVVGTQEASTFLVAEGMSIQTVIDTASDGDTILVNAGTYQEQLDIEGFSNLTIKAVGEVILEMPDAPAITVTELDERDRSAVVTIENSENIIIEGFTIDGRSLGDEIESENRPDFEGILLVDSSAALSNLEIKNIRQEFNEDGTLKGQQRGQGIVAYNTDGVEREITIQDSEISAFQKAGIYMNGEGLSANIYSNTIIGHGFLPELEAIAQKSVILEDGAYAVIDSNHFSEIGYLRGDFTTANVLLEQAADGIVITNNTFDAATDLNGVPQAATHFGVHIMGETDAVEISGNIFNQLTFGIAATENADDAMIYDNQFNQMFPFVITNNGYGIHEGRNIIFDASENDFGIWMEFTDGNDYIIGTAFDDLIGSGGGNDIIILGEGRDDVAFGADQGLNIIKDFDRSEDIIHIADSGVSDFYDIKQTSSGSSIILTFANTRVLFENNSEDGYFSATELPDVYSHKGTSENDDIMGEQFASDHMIGYEGNDTIRGLGGDNILEGQEGDDFLIAWGGDDILTGDAGNDTLIGGAGNNILAGGEGQDEFRISAHDGMDVIQDFEQGLDQINLNPAGVAAWEDLLIETEDGDSIISFGENTLVVQGVTALSMDDFKGLSSNSGSDSDDDIVGSRYDDHIMGGGGNDTLRGLEGDDMLEGETGNDFLIGREGNDWLEGGLGDDTLLGGVGNDVLIGGEGADRFRFYANDGEDIIKDFEQGVDLINMRAAGVTDFAQLAITEDLLESKSIVQFEGVMVELEGVTGLTSSDFII